MNLSTFAASPLKPWRICSLGSAVREDGTLYFMYLRQFFVGTGRKVVRYGS